MVTALQGIIAETAVINDRIRKKHMRLSHLRKRGRAFRAK